MESFFLFGGLERFAKAHEEHHEHRNDALFGDMYEDDEIADLDDDAPDDGEDSAFHERLENHELVRDAQAFERLCADVAARLRKSRARQRHAPVLAHSAQNAFSGTALEERRVMPYREDREAVALVRCAGRVPENMAEALVAEVSGQRHRDCDPECVAYDIEWLTKTRGIVARAIALLEQLFVRYPECRQHILRAIDKGRMIDTMLGRRIIDTFSVWLNKAAQEDV